MSFMRSGTSPAIAGNPVGRLGTKCREPAHIGQWPGCGLVLAQHLLQRMRDLQHLGIAAVGTDHRDAEWLSQMIDAAGSVTVHVSAMVGA